MLMIRHEILRYELSGSGAPNVNFRENICSEEDLRCLVVLNYILVGCPRWFNTVSTLAYN